MTEPHTERAPQPELRAFPKYIDTRVKALVYGNPELLRGAGYLRNGSQATATLARLRHNVGKPLGADPDILAWTIADLPQSRPTDADQPTDRELASHTALTLFALHQQSNHDSSAHRLGTSFGRACAFLRVGTPNTKGIDRRFTAVQTSTDWEETVRHARGLVQLLKAGRQPFDYAHFAEDLVTLRDPDRATGVRLRWGRDFVRPVKTNATPGEN
ncbi:type I-E CRISPR-associated protein Cse2/CasB [Pseudoclavibacter caeni]|jgi:CRISPR system Cascade subunit CasB|uniref:Type I-E CRISPR-associated protein Cse2/CasB n=1 Tax=Pseudoclavibacter caeni TaxID=908846 RepID=A0A7C8BM99_9MICO|nr:type I-E CRISPR-associated protein Cse2/CasB [Pseudoclavibacter caeni]KAB1631043.1 type I-E CRISPR-associated protein Cse2/CasB [Pseudoclavibacter caeni]NYJ96131.1 CRISPR system Cascade subunit CasB [Pseudoclavibacter caeni]